MKFKYIIIFSLLLLPVFLIHNGCGTGFMLKDALDSGSSADENKPAASQGSTNANPDKR